jgi:hypothetical protein
MKLQGTNGRSGEPWMVALGQGGLQRAIRGHSRIWRALRDHRHPQREAGGYRDIQRAIQGHKKFFRAANSLIHANNFPLF